MKIIWFSYLNLASQSNIDITGMFQKIQSKAKNRKMQNTKRK